jgi:hypothetical protein
MPDRRYRVLVVASHPVQYMAPILRRMATHPALDLQVVYCTMRGAEAGHDPEFDASVQWDVPLLDGYTWSQPRNRGSGAESFFGLFNPGIWRHIRRGNLLRGTPWFPLAFMFFLYSGILLIPMTFMGMQAYEDFVVNAYFWLLMGILFRLPTLAVSAQFAAGAQIAPVYDPRIRMR